MTSAHVRDHIEVPAPSIEEVSAGIFGYVQLDGSWGLNNTGFIVGAESVLVVDTCFTERRTRWFREAVEKTAGALTQSGFDGHPSPAAAGEGRTEKPIRTLVNTHHHGDHTHGNWVFADTATIVGHEKCREEVIAAGHSTTGLFPGVEWGEIRIAPPEVTFEERLTLWVDDLKVELIYMGPAHTTNDIVAWIPDQKVLFSGDLVFNGGTPFAMMGSVAGWLEALERMKALGAETIVPGHGPVCGARAFGEQEAYLRWLQELAKKGFEAGAGPLEVAREADLGRFADLLDPERLVGNLHRAYSELRGEERGTPLALGAVMPEMIAYNGGQMPRCLA
jgi:cyclase